MKNMDFLTIVWWPSCVLQKGISCIHNLFSCISALVICRLGFVYIVCLLTNIIFSG